MKGYSAEGIIIKRSDFMESDRIITLYTPSHGKVSVVARGVRKPSSKRAGSLELFNRIHCFITPGRGELETLTEVKIIDSFSSWRSQLGRVALAYQCIEAVDKLTPDRLPQAQVYDYLLNFLQQISSLGVDWRQQTLRQMKILLEILGHRDPADTKQINIMEQAEEAAGRPLYSQRIISRLTQK